MLTRLLLLTSAIALLSFRETALSADSVAPGERLVNPTVSWFGELTEPLPKLDSFLIADHKVWERFWTGAKLPGPVPRVNFETHVVTVSQHRGWSRVWATVLRVQKDGTARLDNFSTPERIFGSYAIAAYPRTGLSSINGTSLTSSK